ncbi:MAG TPA: choice-of-anchor P family protein [Acidobacteriota bacterium]|jgi:hypothetical protein
MKKKSQQHFLKCSFSVCLGLALVAACFSVAEAGTYTGRAFGAYVNVPSLGAGPLYLTDTGQLPSTGGWEAAGNVTAGVPGVLSANVPNSATSAGTGLVNSSSSLAGVVVLAGQAAELTVSFVRAQARATELGSGGSTEIDSLTFGGIPIAVTGLPNQTVSIPGVATLIINEQSASGAGSQGITVNALHLTLATGGEVILASVGSSVSSGTTILPVSYKTVYKNSLDANLTMAALKWVAGRSLGVPFLQFVWDQAPGPCFDFVTGGGHFQPRCPAPPGPPLECPAGRVSWGFNAGARSENNTEIKGHFNLVDHNDQTHIKGVDVDVYNAVASDPCHCRLFEGNAELTGGAAQLAAQIAASKGCVAPTQFRYRAVVCDYGEPGRDDRIQVLVKNVTPGSCQGDVVYFADNLKPSKICPAGEPECGDLDPTDDDNDGGNIQLHKPCDQPGCPTDSKKDTVNAGTAPPALAEKIPHWSAYIRSSGRFRPII